MRLPKITLFVTALMAASSLVPAGAYAQGRPVDPAVYQKLDVFAHVLEKIRTSYVTPVTETEVIENAINGMLTSLDPHSAYLKQEDFEGLQEQTKGEFGGLGIEVTMDNGLVKVVSPIEDTPAAKAGIESGDLIIRLDDKDVQGMSLKNAVDQMRGKPGSKIRLSIFRESEKRTFEVTLVRAVIQVKPVKSKLLEAGMGYLRITSFNDYTDDTLQGHLKALAEQNKGPLNGLILDLRNNPGGLLNQAIAVSDEFLNSGEIVSTRGRIPGQNARYSARKGDLMEGKPIVVMINGGSASAAEIVAGALKDQRRAVLVGTKSFGKGSVQTIFNLPGNTGMRLTTALYYTPAGTSIQAEGILPDVEVKPIKTKEMEKAGLDESDLPSEASLSGHIEVRGTTEGKVSATVAPSRTDVPVGIYSVPAPKTPSDTLAGMDGKPDNQLDRAVGVLRVLISGGAAPVAHTSATTPAAR